MEAKAEDDGAENGGSTATRNTGSNASEGGASAGPSAGPSTANQVNHRYALRGKKPAVEPQHEGHPDFRAGPSNAEQTPPEFKTPPPKGNTTGRRKKAGAKDKVAFDMIPENSLVSTKEDHAPAPACHQTQEIVHPEPFPNPSAADTKAAGRLPRPKTSAEPKAGAEKLRDENPAPAEKHTGLGETAASASSGRKTKRLLRRDTFGACFYLPPGDGFEVPESSDKQANS
ncbi:hypothetical protein HPB51_005789 [Rhipicephalus microplus]|uniref:Uncharacterized protein n=1 Tax=Rhipicephalus microplus TaxID=6941 RepID=A0A9J6ELW6_RHIMP|nr:uncharacterized protein LOC119180976 [Rhipicephalus microplus]KAH8035507.1 hypothetical protein HPB51_005789 [Rhipicephalus microplus]